MPNFWTSTSQKIYEAFNGPRTRDIEFDKKVEEMKVTLGAVKKVRETIHNFPSRTSGIQITCKEIYTNFLTCYGNNPFYSDFVKEICDAHHSVENAYLSMAETINAISKMTNEFDKKYADIHNNLQRREEARQIYDHYDVKMERLVLERNEKVSKNQPEVSKDIEKFDRNDGKYKRAANDLIQMSSYCFKLIQELLDYRFQVLNPLIAGFVNEEKKFFDACSNLFRRFEYITQKVENLNRNFQSTPINYNPSKYIRANRLLMGVNTNTLPKVVRKEKYTYEDYKNRNQQNINTTTPYGGNTTFNNNNNNQNNNNSKFSYAAYANSSNKTSSIIPNTNINTTNPYSGNAPSSSNLNQSTIPGKFSYEAYKTRTQNLANTSSIDNNTSTYGKYSNPYQNPQSKETNFNNPYIIQNKSSSESKPINDYNFGTDYSKSNISQVNISTYNPYANISFDQKPNQMNTTNDNPFGAPGNNASFFQPSGNDYLKYSLNANQNSKGGFYDQDFPK